MRPNKFNDVYEYIMSFSKKKQDILKKIRTVIQEVAPNAEECISYQMPTYKQNGVLLSFAVFAKHIGLYPTPSGIEKFKEELSKYKTAKGSVQFPLDKAIPYDLIKRITEFRVQENA